MQPDTAMLIVFDPQIWWVGTANRPSGPRGIVVPRHDIGTPAPRAQTLVVAVMRRDQFGPSEADIGGRRAMADVAPLLYAPTLLVGMLVVAFGLRRDRRRHELVQAEERARIRREAHNRISNRLSALAIRAELAAKIQAEATTLLLSLPETLRNSVAELRDIIADEAGDPREPPAARLERICRRRAADHDFAVTCDIRIDESSPLDPLTGDAIASSLEEALGNIAKHAGARTVLVSVADETDELGPKYAMTVTDDGCGFTPPEDLGVLERNGHLGLAGIALRARELGGNLAIESAAGKGTTLRMSWRPRRH
jgi:signal transduction histidine kinase